MSRPKWMTGTSKVDRAAQKRERAQAAIEAELRALPVSDAVHVMLSLSERWLPAIREAARSEFARRDAALSSDGGTGR